VRDEVRFDFSRRSRIGLSEAVLCEGKSVSQIEHIAELALERREPLLLTRLSTATHDALGAHVRESADFDAVSRTAILGECGPLREPAAVAIVSAGSSDVPVAREAQRTLAFYGHAADMILDVGVAGLWRIMEHHQRLTGYQAIVVVAGMDGALFSVVGGLVGGVVIAVPTATGYGASHGGTTALHAALASCAPGVVAVNVGNGYGAACAALRVLRSPG
jgi:NCAIR mutase (PurE)-related protein